MIMKITMIAKYYCHYTLLGLFKSKALIWAQTEMAVV